MDSKKLEILIDWNYIVELVSQIKDTHQNHMAQSTLVCSTKLFFHIRLGLLKQPFRFL